MIWPILEHVIREGETYPWPRDMTFEAAERMWADPQWRVFAALDEGRCVGTYFIRPNHQGPAAHIANAGYAVAPAERGRGLGKRMCVHSLDRARESGYRAMQFNMVVSTNPGAHAAWRACGFGDVGVLKEA